MPLVMIIEDEPVLRSSMSRGLARLPDIEVIDAGLFRDAVRLLDVERPDLIVSDLDLPDGSGVEILGVLDRLGRRIPVVFVTAYLGSFRGQLPNRKDVEVYEKPLPLARLREVVLRHFKTTGAEIESPFTLADYLQLACMGRHSVRLEVVRRGEVAGAIDVYRGQVWAARAGDAQGEQAVAVLAFGTPGASTVVKRTGEDPGPRDVHKPWQHILLNAARLHDEALRDRERRPDESGELPSGIDDALGDPSLSPPSTRPGAVRPPALRIVPTPTGSPAPPPVALTPATTPPLLQTSPPGALPLLPAHLASASEVAGKGGRAIGRLPPPLPLLRRARVRGRRSTGGAVRRRRRRARPSLGDVARGRRRWSRSRC
ncbi:MAG: response regulator [Myxococcales bacterium]|nr:response regulator [Myxococcales bacterium]